MTQDSSDNWVWGPYPVHDSPCRNRLAHPTAQQLVDAPGHARTSTRRDPSDPGTTALLEHWRELQTARTLGRIQIWYWSDRLSGPEEPRAQTPWPDVDAVARLAPGELTCLGTRSCSREARAGYDIAVHNAARKLRVVMFAPDLTPRNPVPGLTVYREANLTLARIKERLRDELDHGTPAQLVVVDRLQLLALQDGDSARIRLPEQVDEAVRELKLLAKTEPLGTPAVLLMARLERPRRDGHPLHLDDLGGAAELEYADTLALLDRTQQHEVDVLIAKDRHGPAPRHLTVQW
ncbi:DnaB-like helicase C-terminal domain-containing protein [Streptomyces sp. NPDC059582]|uniref:DnaB-like helicase C-terminal domain-containing protein n=1 Tax=Streptomyces sp. NPDC059582 TaxID=3346875 RepID=UPI0036A56FBF